MHQRLGPHARISKWINYEGANCQADGQEPTPSADVTIRTVNLYGLSAASEIQTGKENLKRKQQMRW